MSTGKVLHNHEFCTVGFRDTAVNMVSEAPFLQIMHYHGFGRYRHFQGFHFLKGYPPKYTLGTYEICILLQPGKEIIILADLTIDQTNCYIAKGKVFHI